ncbi:MAG: hypothetical protein DRI97_08000 [Bacteroidetes bacterium]|nr:MAG: hypothetical protein DRI97_08000 [Bacteroidota bacterium]
MRIKNMVTGILICFSFISINAQSNSKADNTEILLIGSSYFNYNDLKGMIQGLADGSAKDIYIEMCGQNGLYLSDHASSSSTEAKINERDWDYVVLQGVGVLVAYPNHFTDHPVYPALVTLRDKINANYESTRMIFCMPWAFEDGMTWYQNWPDTYEDMQWHIYDTSLQYSEEIGFEIAPVGWAWYAVLEACNYPLHYLHQNDWNHPSLRGSYLMACVVYSTIFQESTVGIPYYGGVLEVEAKYYQSVASDTVLNNLELWNISPLVSLRDQQKDVGAIQLKQNYPNPFICSTVIEYSTTKKQEIRIDILDAAGKMILGLVNRMHNPGKYQIEFNASGLPKGHYTCRLIAGSYCHTLHLIHE